MMERPSQEELDRVNAWREHVEVQAVLGYLAAKDPCKEVFFRGTPVSKLHGQLSVEQLRGLVYEAMTCNSALEWTIERSKA